MAHCMETYLSSRVLTHPGMAWESPSPDLTTGSGMSRLNVGVGSEKQTLPPSSDNSSATIGISVPVTRGRVFGRVETSRRVSRVR